MVVGLILAVLTKVVVFAPPIVYQVVVTTALCSTAARNKRSLEQENDALMSLFKPLSQSSHSKKTHRHPLKRGLPFPLQSCWPILTGVSLWHYRVGFAHGLEDTLSGSTRCTEVFAQFLHCELLLPTELVDVWVELVTAREVTLHIAEGGVVLLGGREFLGEGCGHVDEC